MTPDTIFNSFWFLALMVLMGVCTHWLKQLVMMKKATPSGFGHITLKAYWVDHWPETLMAATSAAAAVTLLYEIEHLTAASAWGAGYLGNSAADMIGGRVQAMINAGTTAVANQIANPPPKP
jgi:hypothetical protein